MRRSGAPLLLGAALALALTISPVAANAREVSVELDSPALAAPKLEDTEAPDIELSSRTPANANGWSRDDVVLTWTCTDRGSGVVAPSVSVTVSGEGASQSATGVCQDHAGNRSFDTQHGINVDRTPPDALLAVDRGPAPTGRYGALTGAPSVTITCADALSGVAAGACPTSHTFGQGEDQSLVFTVSDLAGNTASASIAGIDVDLAAQ